MAYTVIDKPSDYFNTVLYTGNTSNGHEINGLDFTPSWVWIKSRDGDAFDHMLFDSVRASTTAAPFELRSNKTNAESTDTSGLVSFDSDGFTLNSGGYVNTGSFVSWNWRTGTAFSNDASSTSIGTLDSAGSSNQEAGFSIVSYTSNGSSNQSVAHNLGGVPEMIISKNRDSGSASYNYWTVYHHSLATANDKKLKLNTTDAASTTNEWGDTDPTSTVYSLHTSGDGTTNHSTDKMISYCFRSIKGYSKFSSYIGNGNADGTFVHLGFKPAFIMAKCSSASGDWVITDVKRNPYNALSKRLFPNQSIAESTTNNWYDALSNGFKARLSDGTHNGSGKTYLYAAFAESPFVTSTGIPATAR
mgnify:CR=1 FL=1